MRWLSGVVLAGGVSAWAQVPATPPGNPNQPNPVGQCSFTVTSGDGQTVTGTKSCTGQQQMPLDTPIAKRLPFPGEPADNPQPLGPETPGAPSSSSEPNAAGAPSSNSGPMKDAGSSGESSSSSSSSSSSASVPAEGPPPDPDDVNSDTPVAPKRNLHKKPPMTMADRSVAEQEANDMQVAGFYANDGNWRGAYGRAADAVKLIDDDPDAHLALANAARKLGKLDEAVKEYKRTLALDPVPKSRKEADKALKEMAGEN